MTDYSLARNLTFYSPAHYRIRLIGWIQENWSERLEGMAISQNTPDEGLVISTLEGELLDQAALLGVLNTLYELHLPVLSVRCLASTDAIEQGTLP